VEALKRNIASDNGTHKYAKVYMKLEDIVDGDFFNHYIKSGKWTPAHFTISLIYFQAISSCYRRDDQVSITSSPLLKESCASRSISLLSSVWDWRENLYRMKGESMSRRDTVCSIWYQV
jgi:hypothetical protein